MELELQMRHFLVNIEKISLSFFHSPRQHLPHVVSGWTAQSAHPFSPWLLPGLSCASPGSHPVSKPQVSCFLLYLPPRFVLLQALSGYNNCYHSLPRFAPGALHSKRAAPGISHTQVSHRATPKSRRWTLKSPFTCPAGLCCWFCGSVQHKKP